MNALNSMKNYAKKLIGQKVSVITSKTQFRGVLFGAGDFLVIANARQIWLSGGSDQEKCNLECLIDENVFLNWDSIREIYRPKWANAPLSDGIIDSVNSIKDLVGQEIIVSCQRSDYQGILSEIGENHIVISNPKEIVRFLSGENKSKKEWRFEYSQLENEIAINSSSIDFILKANKE
jgi:hypothetical protein